MIATLGCSQKPVHKAASGNLEEMGAPLEKRRFGASAESTAYNVRAEDHYAFDVIQQISAER